MDLWIESQFNKLIKVHNIQPNFKSIICFDVAEGLVTLGNYKSDERALEVLKEIEKFMITTINGAINQSNVVLNCIIFDMPKE